MDKVIENKKENYYDLTGKRLLILGGMRMACDIVKRAQAMGVYVVVADMTEGAPAKQLADKAIYADVTNVDVIVDICKKEHIDGITTGFVDILLKPCRDACDILGMPYYASDLLIAMSTDKNTYKANCRKYGVPVPEDYSLTDINDENQISKLKFPVFIKPADNSGSRGAYACHTREELIENWPKALAFSPTKTVVVEQCLTGQDIILDYLIQNGEAHLLSIFDRKMCSYRRNAVNHANLLLTPSESNDLFIEEVNPKIVKMCKELGFKDGLLFFQGYSNNGTITLFEMGCRLGGTFSNIDEYFLGVNPIDALVHYALTGKMSKNADYEKITSAFDGAGAVVNILLTEDAKEISKITGVEELNNMPAVKNIIQFYQEGESVPQNNATDKPFMILYLAADSYDELKKVILDIDKVVNVQGSDGKSILLPMYHL